MPCDQIIRNSVELSIADRELLKRALEADGLTFTESNGVLFVTYQDAAGRTRNLQIAKDRVNLDNGEEHMADRIKRAYAVETVKTAAKKFGWQIKKTTADSRKFAVLKRGV
jgi:hypothetical protein